MQQEYHMRNMSGIELLDVLERNAKPQVLRWSGGKSGFLLG